MRNKSLVILYALILISAELFLILPKTYYNLFDYQIRANFTFLFVLSLIALCFFIFIVNGRIIVIKTSVPNMFFYSILIWFVSTFLFTLFNHIIYPSLDDYIIKTIIEFSKWASGIAVLYIGLRFIRWEESDLKQIFILMTILSVAICSILIYRYRLFDIHNWIYLSPKENRIYSVWESIAKNEIPEVLTLISLILLSILATERRRSLRLTYIIFAVVLILTSLFFFSRESYLTMFAGFFFLIMIKRVTNISKVIAWSLLGVSLIFFLRMPFGRRVTDSIQTIDVDPNVATSFRLDRWTSAIEIGLKHPLTGVGFCGFENFEKNHQGTSAHNAFLQSLCIGGIPQLVIFLIVLFNVYKEIRKALQKKGTIFLKSFVEGLFSFYIGYVISALFSDHFISFYYLNLIFWGLFAIAISIAERTSQNNGEVDPPRLLSYS